MKIHMCCGKRNFGPDWIHIDGSKFDHVNIVTTNLVKLPIPSQSASLIYCSHALEYFDRDEIQEVLLEWHRILAPKGLLRIAVPDFESMIKLYINQGYSLEFFLGPLYGKIEMDNKKIYHKTVYDFNSIKILLSELGFKDIRKYNWRSTEHAHIDDHSQAYIPHMDKINGTLISLNIECNKD